MTTTCLLGSGFVLFSVLENFERTNQSLSSLLAKQHESKKLIKAKECLKHKETSISEYVSSHIESMALLADVKHRYEHAIYPKTPLELSPTSNFIKHNQETTSYKGFKRHCFMTHQPFLADEEDLKKLFCYVEGLAIFPYKMEAQTPYLNFTSFHMKKRTLSTLEKAFEITYVLEGLSL